ncbi:MAG: hypothetical protein AMJ78_02815 [Omnitrophica WOR_2 bacterium SM23_29]|nr:MAG: hypothetical protein AMJ78_02815 [Omnitrophica WOR_2 bacterium SM23_29]
MRKTAIVFALFNELLPVARSLGIPFFKSMQSQITLDDRNIALVRSGIGKDKARRTAEKIVLKFRPEVIISAGFCGALVDDLKVGDIVASDFSDGKIFCSNNPLCTYEKKMAAHRQHKAVVVDMESEGVAVIARKYGIDFLVIKAVSDSLKDDIPKLPFAVLSLPRLIHFKRQADIASKRLSKFLLDYLQEGK